MCSHPKMKNNRLKLCCGWCRYLAIILLFISITNTSNAQKLYTVSGYVLDNSTILPIPSATIKLPNDKYDISTESGSFSFTVAAGDTVIFSSIGFSPYTFVLDSANVLSKYRIYMKAMSYQLNSVVVHGEKKKGAVLKATDYLDDVSSPITFFGKDARTRRKISKLETQETVKTKHIYWQCNNELITQFSGLTGSELDECTVYCNTHISLAPNDTRMSITHKLLTVISEYLKEKDGEE